MERAVGLNSEDFGLDLNSAKESCGFCGRIMQTSFWSSLSFCKTSQLPSVASAGPCNCTLFRYYGSVAQLVRIILKSIFICGSVILQNNFME